MSCRAHATKSILQIWSASHAHGFGGETFNIGRDSFVCRLMLQFTGVVKVANSPPRSHYGQFAFFFQCSRSEGKFSSIITVCARLNANPNIQTTFFFPISIKKLLLKQNQLAQEKKSKRKLINYLKYTKKMKNEISLRFPSLLPSFFFHIICNLLAWHC